MNALTFKGFWFALVVMASCVARGETLTLTDPGAGSVTVPAGYDWTNVTVQCWGAGGGGTPGLGYSGAGGGGGGQGQSTDMPPPSSVLPGRFGPIASFVGSSMVGAEPEQPGTPQADGGPNLQADNPNMENQPTRPPLVEGQPLPQGYTPGTDVASARTKQEFIRLPIGSMYVDHQGIVRKKLTRAEILERYAREDVGEAAFDSLRSLGSSPMAFMKPNYKTGRFEIDYQLVANARQDAAERRAAEEKRARDEADRKEKAEEKRAKDEADRKEKAEEKRRQEKMDAMAIAREAREAAKDHRELERQLNAEAKELAEGEWKEKGKAYAALALLGAGGITLAALAWRRRRSIRRFRPNPI